MKFLFTLFSFLMLTISSSASSLDSLRSETRGDQLFVIHEVEEEETLYSIAKRYRSSIPAIIEHNKLEGNRIEIGQILSILYAIPEEEDDQTITKTPDGFHRIEPGETLYSISRMYDLRVRDLRNLNNLESNDISPGEYLRVSEVTELADEPETIELDDQVSDDSVSSEEENEIPEGFDSYIVQTAETLNSIARKRNVAVSDIKEWNNLNSDYIKIGQTLLIRQMSDSIAIDTDSTQVVSKLNEDGFEKIYEEGIAGVISDISTSKYLALHRSMPIGTELEVRNLMNNFVVHVKVVGKLPDTGVNRNILLRLSKPAFEQLGILDPKSRVEVSHFKK